MELNPFTIDSYTIVPFLEDHVVQFKTELSGKEYILNAVILETLLGDLERSHGENAFNVAVSQISDSISQELNVLQCRIGV